MMALNNRNWLNINYTISLDICSKYAAPIEIDSSPGPGGINKLLNPLVHL